MGSWILLKVMMPPDIITKISLILVTNLRTDIDFEYSPGYLLIMNMLPVPDIYTDTNMHPDIDYGYDTDIAFAYVHGKLFTNMLTDTDHGYAHRY